MGKRGHPVCRLIPLFPIPNFLLFLKPPGHFAVYTIKTPKKGGGNMDDSTIIDLYWSRDQRAIEETAGKYGSFLFSLVWNILRSHSDTEECVNDTYLRTWNAIPRHGPRHFGPGWAGSPGICLWTAGNRAGRKSGAVMPWRYCWANWTTASPLRTEWKSNWRIRRLHLWSAVFYGVSRRRAARSSCGGTGTVRIWRTSRRN